MTTLIQAREPIRKAVTDRSSTGRPATEVGLALWNLGFRPFYLVASIFSALSIAAWSAQFAGWLPDAYLSGSLWHAHEMLFGYVLAVMIGFLLTATRAWTDRKTATGIPLMFLVLLWLTARVLVLTPYGWAAAVANTALPLAAAIALAIPLIRAGSRRNYFFIALLLLLAGASLSMHLGQLGVVELPAWLSLQIALDVVLFIMVVVAGRVIPMFTNNGVPGSGARRLAWLDRLALGLTLGVLVADAIQLSTIPLAALLFCCALAHGARLCLWKPWRTLRTPLVWVLHAAYAWIVLHLSLRGFSALGLTGASVATHALSVGAIGSLTLGMMTRTARGHTGRPLNADRADVTCYLLILASASIRVCMPLLWPAQLVTWVILSGILWSAGFALFAVRYWPVLARPRLDGRPG